MLPHQTVAPDKSQNNEGTISLLDSGCYQRCFSEMALSAEISEDSNRGSSRSSCHQIEMKSIQLYRKKVLPNRIRSLKKTEFFLTIALSYIIGVSN